MLVRTDNTAAVSYINHQGVSTGTGCHGTDVAKALSVRLSPNCSAPRSSGVSARTRSVYYW